MPRCQANCSQDEFTTPSIKYVPESALSQLIQNVRGEQQYWLFAVPANDVALIAKYFEASAGLTFSSNVFAVAFASNQSVALFEVFRTTDLMAVTVNEVRSSSLFLISKSG